MPYISTATVSTFTPSIHPHQNASCPIIQLYVQPYQRQDSITWYPIKIETYRQCYEVKYRYSELSQFSRNIHQHYKISKRNLPMLKNEHQFSQLFQKRGTENHQKYIDRQAGLEMFCEKLLQLPARITCSNLFLSFFAAEKKQQLTTTATKASSTNLTLKRVFPLKSPVVYKQKQHKEYDNYLSRYSTVTVSNLPSPHCYHYKKASMISTNTTINTSTASGSKRSSTSSSSIIFSSSLSSEEYLPTIKLKIIYDWHNIIVIRVSRSVSLDQLRSRVLQKFALLNIQLPDQFVFISPSTSYCSLTTNTRNSSATTASIICSDSLDLGLATLISEEEHLSTAMQTKWSCLQKVTLRCMV
jgi:hypothetical protein